MKKTVLLLMVVFIAFSMVSQCGFCTEMPAVAQDAGFEVFLETRMGTYFKSEQVSVDCLIRSSEKIEGARALMYVDGALLEHAGAGYLTFEGESRHTFSFTVLPELDANVSHVLMIEIIDANGKSASCSGEFRVSRELKRITLSKALEPSGVAVGSDAYCTVRFDIPGAFAVYRGIVRVEVNGVELPELDEDITFYNGAQFTKTVPGKYLNTDGYNSFVKIILNPGDNPAVSHSSYEFMVPMLNEKGARFAEVDQKVNPLMIPAMVTKNTAAYAYAGLSGYRTTLSRGEYVEYMNPDSSTSMRAARVRTASGGVYWVPMSALYITRENLTIADNLTDEEREVFVNGMGYESPTPYLIWVNKERQRLTVFLGKRGEWKALKTFPVATGTNLTPTPTEVCTYEYPTRWVTSTYTCSPVMYLHDGYAIHNQPVSLSGYVTDRTIGKPASHGCIRMIQADINWVHSYVPVKTTVVLY